MAKKRRAYSLEFKLEAVRLLRQKGVSVAQVARDLGVSENVLHSWKRKFEEDPSFGTRPSAEQEEIRRLRKELKRVEQEREILKKAAAYFAKESQ